MKQLRLVLIFSALALCSVRAQRDPEPIPDFSNLDEFIYEPKTTLSFGMRTLSGGKTSFQGHGILKGIEDPGNATDVNITRGYHDGNLSPDTRIIDVVRDADGNPVLDANGAATAIPIEPDGKTNNWRYFYNRQAEESPGFIAMHTYSAAIVDTRITSKDGKGSMGMELAVSRDMGRVFNTRMSWSLTAGMTINDIAATTTRKVQANITKITDLYSLYGVTAPAAPYDSTNPPSSTTAPVFDADGNPVLNADGTPQTIPVVDPPVLLASSPNSRTTTTTTDETSVTTRSRLKGAYYTFRAGPTLWVPVSNRFRASLSVGAALIYAGATYTVNQSYLPETGVEIIEEVTSDEKRVLPGYYADATLQFDITPRTGIYAGAVVQGAGDYNQSIVTPNANYSAKLDFGHQQGFRAGMTVKF